MRKQETKEKNLIGKKSVISDKDILSGLMNDKGTSLFLGKYALNEVLVVMRKRNFLAEAQKRHLWPLDFTLDSSEFPLQKLRIYYGSQKPENLIVDLKIREGRFQIKNKLGLGFLRPEYDFLILEWLTLQNPLLNFDQKRTPLPGQEHPGLSLGKKVLDIFVYLARLTRKDGLLASPAYFHNALLFSRCFHFINPAKEAEVQAIRKSFPHVSFKELAWVVHLNCLRWQGNKVYEWEAEEEVYALDKSLKKYFDSSQYKDKMKESEKNHHFTIDWECYKKKIVNSEK